MAYHYTIETKADHLRVEVEEGADLDDQAGYGKAVLADVARKSHETGITRILAIWKITGQLPTMDAYDIACAPDQFGWGWNFKLAIVYHDEERLKAARFAENVAVNRGYKVRMFRAEPDARQWLLGDNA